MLEPPTRNSFKREFRIALSTACVCLTVCVGAITLGSMRTSLSWAKGTCDINAASMFVWVDNTRQLQIMQTYHATVTDTTGERRNVTSACQDFDESTEACKVLNKHANHYCIYFIIAPTNMYTHVRAHVGAYIQSECICSGPVQMCMFMYAQHG